MNIEVGVCSTISTFSCAFLAPCWNLRCRRNYSLALSNDPESETRSIGDVVQNLHGGKYKFETPGSFSPMSQQFAESLYSSGEADAAAASQESVFENENDLPGWVQRLGPPSSSTATRNDFNDWQVNSAQTFTIQNQERTWERFYAKIVTTTESASVPFQVKPWQGMLAPRGVSASGLTDSTILKVSCIDEGSLNSDEWWLAVGTEEDTWHFRLN